MSKTKASKIKKKIYQYFKYFFRSTLTIVYINFKCLPFKQAIKLPIWINSREYLFHIGKIEIDSKVIFPGMIMIGLKHDFYYKKGVSLKNNGLIVFKGHCIIGNESVIEVFKNAKLIFGDFFGASCSSFFCSKQISFGDNCAVGKNSVFMDTDFHVVSDLKNNKNIETIIPIKIGNNNWFGYQCLIMKGTETSDNCIYSARSVTIRHSKTIPFCVMAGMPAIIVKSNYYRDPHNDDPYCYIDKLKLNQ